MRPAAEAAAPRPMGADVANYFASSASNLGNLHALSDHSCCLQPMLETVQVATAMGDQAVSIQVWYSEVSFEDTVREGVRKCKRAAAAA